MVTVQRQGTKICLLGASFDTGNLGVSALAESSIKCILHRWPDAEITLLDGGPELGEYCLEVQGQEIRLSLVPIRFCKNVFLPNHFLVLTFYALLLRLFPLQWLREKAVTNNKCLKQILEAHLIADITAGDSFSDVYGVRRFLLGFLRKWLVVQFGKKLVMLPQTYGPFKRPILRLMAKYILKRSMAVYSRDKGSVNYLRRILNGQYVNEKVRFVPDVAFVLDPHRPEHPGIDSIADRDREDTIVVGLNVSGLLFNGGYTRDNMFCLSVDYRRLINAIIDFFMEKKDVLVVLIPHVFPPRGLEVESDFEACLQVYKVTRPKYMNRIFIVEGRYNHNEIKYVIGMFDFFVGSRMHSCIASMSQCVPTVGVAYSEKFHGVFETAGIEQYVADMRLNTQEEILVTISKAFRERLAIAAHLNSVVPDLKKTVLNMFESIA